MNEVELVETHLKRWTPRTPAALRRKRVFGATPITAPRSEWGAFTLTRWLVPAVGCALVVCATLNTQFASRQNIHLAATNLLIPLSAAPSVARVAYAAAPEHSDINNVPARRLEWSFGSRSTALDLGAQLISYTNTLIQ